MSLTLKARDHVFSSPRPAGPGRDFGAVAVNAMAGLPIEIRSESHTF